MKIIYLSEEIQSELIENNFLDIYKKILTKFSTNNLIIFNIISCLRRFKDEEFMQKIAEELLFTFFALFDYYYLTLKNKLESDTQNQLSKIEENKTKNLSNLDMTNLKEIIALLGNIIKNEIHQKPFMQKNLHLVLIDVIISFIEYPKIIKNTLGTMINLTSNSEIRNEISKISAFVKSFFLVAEKYNESALIVDYQLKLLLNMLKNGNYLYYFFLFF